MNDTERKHMAKAIESRLSIRNLSHSYDRWGVRVDALHSVSAEFEPGEWSVLIGPNGAGKSTLLNLISNAITPNRTGEMRIAGQRIDRLSLRECAQVLLHVRQNPVSGTAPE